VREHLGAHEPVQLVHAVGLPAGRRCCCCCCNAAAASGDARCTPAPRGRTAAAAAGAEPLTGMVN
jgi:hypothetical protein